MFNKGRFNLFPFNNSKSSNVSIPIITIISQTLEVISDEEGFTYTVITFKSDTYIECWEARANGEGVGQGLLVGSGLAVQALEEVSFNVDYTELTSGDIPYKINIYGKNESGWSIYE